jgi:hypothetical protein
MANLSRLITLALLGLAIPAEPVFAGEPKFECLRDHRSSSAVKRDEVRMRLPTGNAIDDPSRLGATVSKLRSDGMPEALIAEHLTGAYCRALSQDTSLSGVEKTARARRFAAQITALLRQQDSNTMIIDVPLKPGVVAAVISAARKDGLSIDGWISRVVETELQQK